MDLENSRESDLDDFCYMWQVPPNAEPLYNDIQMEFFDDDNVEEEEEKNKSEKTMNPERNSNGPFRIIDLPPELLESIFRNLTFENIGKVRRVSQYFNTIGSSILNSEFNRLRMSMQQRFQNIKAQMPRRESARRKHPLARESDIIETLHMRLTLLHMTFGKHIERKHCCFFAGEILDEVYRILNYVKVTPNLSRAYKVTDELFDLSTMAMEYFKEHIEPSLPEITYFATDFLEYTSTLSTSSPKTPLSLLEESSACSCSSLSKSSVTEPLPVHSSVSPAVNKRLRKLRETMKRNNGQVIAVKQELKLTRRKLATHQRHIQELRAHHEDYDRKFQNTSRKLNAVLQELNRCKTELQYWRSKSPAAQCSCGKVTPVFELKEVDNFVADSAANPSSPKKQKSAPEDFKPISSDFDSTPANSRYFVILPSDRISPRECISVPAEAPLQIYPFNDKTPVECIDLTEESHPEKNHHRACKRKLNMRDHDLYVEDVIKASQSKIDGTLENVSMCSVSQSKPMDYNFSAGSSKSRTKRVETVSSGFASLCKTSDSEDEEIVSNISKRLKKNHDFICHQRIEYGNHTALMKKCMSYLHDENDSP